jgi:hypothetical protein
MLNDPKNIGQSPYGQVILKKTRNKKKIVSDDFVSNGDVGVEDNVN